MAEIYPQNPVGRLPAEVLRSFRFLKTLPEGYRVWHRLAPWEKDAPDFLVVKPDGRVLMLSVSLERPEVARSAAQLLLLDTDRPALGEAEEAVLERFAGRFQGQFEPGSRAPGIPRAVLFPNIPGAALDRARERDRDSVPVWLGQEALSEAGQPDWDAAFREPPPAAFDFERLRACFSPEVVVPAALTVRPAPARGHSAGLADFLLDYDQEAALKADLAFPEEASGLSTDLRLNVVNGVAGSGKSLILLHRLRLLHGLFPGKRYLVLTHNRPLLRELKARFFHISGERPKNIDWQTFNSWCRKHWPEKEGWVAPLGEGPRMNLIATLLRERAPALPLSAQLLRSEFDWLKDSLIFNREDYLAADRRGRGFPLSAGQRREVYSLLLEYQQRLAARGRTDWGEVPRALWRFLNEGKLAVEPYDVILIDEAQFFAPLWFDLVRGLLVPRSGHLFIVADPAQGFLGRGTSWKSLGLDVRGHSVRLQRSYRTTSEILNFATLFYRQRDAGSAGDEEIVQPDFTDLPSGLVPQVVPVSTSQDEIARVANEVAAFAGQGLPLRHLLVLHADWRGVERLVGAICTRLGPGAAADPKGRDAGDFVRVTTLNAGTGLESPIVFLVGLNRLFEQEQSLRLSDPEREALVRENTRKIYMAATRAGQRLVLTYVGALDGAIAGLLGGGSEGAGNVRAG